MAKFHYGKSADFAQKKGLVRPVRQFGEALLEAMLFDPGRVGSEP